MADDVQSWIDELVKNNQVVLFMKGTAEFPQCGFSMKTVNIVRSLGVPFTTINVLENFEVREGIKEYSDWPTIPQLYIGGNFVGGSDISIQLFESGELNKLVEASTAE